MIEYRQSHSHEHLKLKVMALKALSSLLLGAYRARCQGYQSVIETKLLSLGEKDENITGEGLSKCSGSALKHS